MITVKTCFLKIGIIGSFLFFLASCSSSKNEVTTPPDNGGDSSSTTLKTGIYTFNNLVVDSTATSTTNAKPLYFSLEEGKIIPSSQAQTTNWDICFNSIYSSNICANDGALSSSPGYGGPGKGSIYLYTDDDAIDAQYYNAPGKPISQVPARNLFDEAFGDITSASVADGKWQKDAIVGLDYFESNTEFGWAYYDFYGQMFPNRPADSVAHVAYALPRPLIIKTAKGHYAKLIIYSLYKNAPDVPTRSNAPGFITMRYAIQMDGTTNLDIKQ